MIRSKFEVSSVFSKVSKVFQQQPQRYQKTPKTAIQMIFTQAKEWYKNMFLYLNPRIEPNDGY